jgi:hypothetical protein
MKDGANLTIPSISVADYSATSVTLQLTKAEGGQFTYEELTDQVLTLTTAESYKIYSQESLRTKLKTETIDIYLDDFKEYEIVSDCIENISYGFKVSEDDKYELGVSEGLELEWTRFMFEEADE